MASAVTDLEAGLQAMLNLKPPGVSGSRITSLTSLCVANIESESVLIQKIYTHFKKAPATHKLGVLYVVDSVTRKWLEQAKSQGQAINSAAPDGTYAAGVHRVTELMPVLMNDILQSCPEEHKEKIKKLLDIWDKGQTFPASLVQSFREKVTAPPVSTTPPGSPPPNLMASLHGGAPPAAAPSTAVSGSSIPTAQKTQSILDALSNIARQSTTAASSAPTAPPPAASHGVPPAGSEPPRPVSASVTQPQWPLPQQQPPAAYPANTQPPTNAPPAFPYGMHQLPQIPGFNGAQGPTPPAGMPAMPQLPGAPAAQGSLDPNMIMTIKTLLDQGIPADKLPAILQSLNAASGQGQQAPAPGPANVFNQAPPSWVPPQQQRSNEPSRDWRGGYNDGMQSPGYGRRSRSRSPNRGWGGSPRNGRQSYDRNSPRGRDGDRNGRRGGDYRERSPVRRHEPTPPPGQKWTDFDPNLERDSIKVLSRTLFVGGVTCPESELRSIFGRYGTVQTCIVNKDKRHAFVKMLSRRDAIAAKKGSEEDRDTGMPLRTRWGVGFGPRDCSDYSSGVSIIPIHRLTEADRKWILTAPYGGSGGTPISTGLVVEEPDIEIGAGVSSKAISRRMQTDKGGANGPKSSRNHREDNGWPDRRAQGSGGDGHHGGAEHADSTQNNPPPGFPFGMGTLPNGMPNFPSGFSFPDPSNQAQPRWQ